MHGDLTQERYFAEPNEFKYENYNATIDWNPGPVSLLSTTSYGVLNSDQITDSTSAVLIPPSTTLGEFLTANFGTPLGGYEDNNAGLEKFTQEIRLASPTSDRLEWQIGGYYTRETGLIDQHLNALTLTGGSAGLPSLEYVTLASTYKESAGFGDVTYHFNSQFDVQLGGRWSTNKQSATESISGLLVGATTFTTPSEGNVFTYSRGAALAHRRGYHGLCPSGHGLSPGRSQCLAAPRAARCPAPVRVGHHRQCRARDPLDAARRTTVHRRRGLPRRLEGHSAARIRRQLRRGCQRRNGAQPGAGMDPRIRAGHGIDVRLGRGLHGCGADLARAGGERPCPAIRCHSPPNGAHRSTAQYEWAAFADYKGFVGTTWSYVGTRSTDFASSAATVPTQVGLPHYDTLAVRAGIENDRYRVELYGKNLGDSRGITDYFSSGAPNLAGELSVIQPRTIGVTLSAKF